MANALDVIEVVAEGHIFSQLLQNVFHFRPVDDVDDEDLKDDLNQWITENFFEAFYTLLVNNVGIERYLFKNATTSADLGQQSYEGLTGTNASEVLPLHTSAVLVFPTAQPKVRGRKFLWPFGVNTIADSLWGSAQVTILNTTAAPFTEGFVGGTSGVTYQNGVLNQAGQFRPFIEAIVTNIPGTQRRRKQGVGA